MQRRRRKRGLPNNIESLFRKKPIGGYQLFLRECVTSLPKDIPQQERFKKCILEWRKLSDEEKEKWREKAREEKRVTIELPQ